MKAIVLSAVCVAVLAAAVFAVGGGRARSADAPAPSGPLQVDDLRRAGPELGALLTVQGVVDEVRPRSRLVGLADAAEAQDCGPDPCEDCTRFVLPVAWQGELPEPGETVTVSGRIEQGTDGLVLAGGRTDR
jgi:hypothetical protein